jgi:hypothetical protein
MFRFAIILCLAAMIVACSPQPQFEPEFNHEGKPIRVELEVYSNRRALNQAYNNWVGKEHAVPLDTNQLGWATWTETTCTIHINGALKKSNTREYIYTLGHEYAHCLYGRYHD